MNLENEKLYLNGNRIYLRTLTEQDATQRYASWLNDAEVNSFLATKSATVNELQEYIAKKNQQFDAILCGIFLKDNDLSIGTVKFEPIDLDSRRARIAVMIGDKTFWGQGFAGEAMELLMKYGFDKLRLTEIDLGVIDKNEAAIRTYHKLGFQEIKRDLKVVEYDGILYDQVWMEFKCPLVV
ncbi:MAG: GNAT family N-acetyltransferase [Patescibacteria group bacterium]